MVHFFCKNLGELWMGYPSFKSPGGVVCGLGQLHFSLSQILPPALPFPGCWCQEHSLTDLLQASLLSSKTQEIQPAPCPYIWTPRASEVTASAYLLSCIKPPGLYCGSLPTWLATLLLIISRGKVKFSSCKFLKEGKFIEVSYISLRKLSPCMKTAIRIFSMPERPWCWV